MKRIAVLLIVLMTASCAKKVVVPAPEFVRGKQYAYVRDTDGKVYIVTTNSRDFDEVIKRIQPGPSSVDKLNLWVVTPLKGKKN